MSGSTTETCTLCGGSGFEPTGETGTVRRCRCAEAHRVERLLQDARIPARYADCRLESFKTTKDHPALRNARSVTLQFAERFPQVEFGLLFLGPCGVGKTHLAVGLLRKLIEEKRADGLFYDFRDLLREIQLSWNSVAQTSELEILRPVLDTEVLVLDDLGANKPTDWVRETVEHIVNRRYNDQKLTIFTSNYLDTPLRPGEEVLTDRIGARLRSRLYEMCKLVEMRGDDFRREIKQANYRF